MHWCCENVHIICVIELVVGKWARGVSRIYEKIESVTYRDTNVGDYEVLNSQNVT
jgi:hypothetical protein